MWDGIIIGGGLSGLIAGLRAVQRGKKVLIIAQGSGSLPYASGTLDFGDLNVLCRRQNHPYSVLGEDKVRRAFAFAQELLPEYQGEWGREQKVFTPLGQIRMATLAPRFLCTEPLYEMGRIVIILPAQLKDFLPRIFKENLTNLFTHAQIELIPLQVEKFVPWYKAGKEISAEAYARFWCSAKGVEVIHEILFSLSPKEAGVILPGVSAAFYRPLREMFAQLPFPLVEITHFPPSPAGQFLYEELKVKFKQWGGEILYGARAISAELQDGICRSLTISSKGKYIKLQGRTYVLAAGGIFGGGIQVSPSQIREEVFGLDVFRTKEWAGSDFFGNQPFAESGIEVDSNLKPRNSKGEAVVENVLICGRMLAHWDPWTEYCGGGVALTSGLAVGELV